MSEIKFEIINGQLCIMVEPTPLTLEATFPCVVVMVQKDKYGRIPMPQEFMIIVTGVSKGRMLCDCKVLKSNYWHYSWFEIVGYPVAEGSKEWALYQMMQGKNVASSNGTVYWQDKDDNDLIKYKDGYGQKWIQTPYMFLRCVDASGWQIYTEPELEFKVGDWVRFTGVDADNYGHIISEENGEYRIQTQYLSGRWILPASHLVKIIPSEVIVNIGCLSGTVRRSAQFIDFIALINDTCIAHISLTALDAPTRELVERLLKAQEEK